MSDHPSTPSFGGPPHFAQQWPPPPSMSSMNLNDPPFNRDHLSSWSHQAQNGPMPSIEYNNLESSRLNSRIPGLNTPNPTGPIPPPFPFMGQFPHQHFPPFPFPPAPLPPMAYPPMPVPAFPTQQNHIPANDTPVNAWPSNTLGSQTTNTSISRQDLDREEGEVTDKEIGGSLPKGANRAVDSYAPQGYDGQNGAPMDVEMAEDINSTGFGARGSHKAAAKSPGAATSAVPDLEEGEAVSSMASNSTRDSGSPYNPPVTVSVEPYDPHYSTESEMRDQPPFVEGLSDKATGASDTKDVPTQPDTIKLPAQLRVQAQGALLGLAPHNIRYNELVEEGINATILRRLYEDVGIKVAAAQPDTATTTQDMAATPLSIQPVNQTTTGQTTASIPDHAQEKEGATLQVPLNEENSLREAESAKKETAPIPSAAQPDTSKPLERKELIARMLAAKAAKTSGAPLPTNATATKETPAAKNAEVGDENKSATSTPLNEAVPKEQDTRVKEKNKAQTELARQRIEQLKKQGLMRSQPKPQSDHTPQATSRQSHSPGQAPAVPSSIQTVTHHPLPDRPPEPEWSGTTRLPGLFMMASEQSPSNNLFSRSEHSNGAGTPRQGRTTPRKRPRASDFDEPTSLPKRPSNHGADVSHAGDRLVIDLSDDEFYGDDENNIDMDTTEDQGPQATSSMISSDPKVPPVRNFSSLAEPLPQKPSSSVNSRNSTSATPQAWGSVDEENLRKKDLAIREMHRKIAELEQRKKPKPTASPTQSPHLLNSSASSLDGHTARTDIRPSCVPSAVMAEGTPNPNNNKIASDHITGANAPQGASPGLSPQILSSMDDSQLEQLRSRYLRKQEIKAGLPSLDAEILKSEAKLAEFKEQKLKLLSEIAKGKQGRQQLIDELRSLDLETNGLTLEDIEAAQHRNAEQRPRVLHNESGLPLTSSGEEDISVPDAPAPKSPSRVECYPLQENVPPLRSHPSPVMAQPSQSGRPDDTDGVAESGKEPSPSSISESEGSAMDESTDSDASESASIEKELSERSPASGAAIVEDSENAKESDQQDISCMSSDHHAQSLPEHQRHTITESQVGEPSAFGHQEHKHEDQESPESSIASEGYEPPEPEEQNTAVSAHSPPFSPPPGPVDSDSSRYPLDQAHADTTLTGNIQGPDSYSREFPKVGLLDNEPRGDDSGRKFTPYISPLKYFKAYRYHPRYIDEVSDGYRSLTYSHDIDSMKYLCPFEAAGGTCNDRSCEFQHFREMNLSDDKVLIQMGSLREGKTPEEKDQYIAGLKQIINEMRRDSVKDFMSVATEIAAYRRRFLQDPSRILPL